MFAKIWSKPPGRFTAARAQVRLKMSANQRRRRLQGLEFARSGIGRFPTQRQILISRGQAELS